MAPKFQLVAGHIALDFANTLDYRYDPERMVELMPSYDRFLAFAEQTGILSPRQAHRLLRETKRRDAVRALERAIELRETLYYLFRSVAKGESPRRSCLRAFNDFLAGRSVPVTIDWRNHEFICGFRDLAETPTGPLWPIIDAAAGLLTSSDRSHVSECCDESCRWLFFDRSKNHSRRWCDMRLCGNRSKARRFQARFREGD